MQPSTCGEGARETSSERENRGRDRPKLVECPFEVRVDGVLYDQFYDVRDANASARAAKQASPNSEIVVADVRTKRLVIRVEE